jgi:glycosyltransferase involved in cell wall biosynthesis
MRQAPGVQQMQILVIDDCSDKDDPESVVRAYGGRVEFFRQPFNAGKAANYQTGLELSRGQLIHQLHGDDLVSDDFYQRMQDCFARWSDCGAFFCESIYIDEHGNAVGRTGREQISSGPLSDFAEVLYCTQRIQTPSMVVRRTVYEALGGFDYRLTACEDWEMWFRAALRFPIGFNAETTALYRVYQNNTSARSVLEGRRVALYRQAVEIMDSYAPADLQQKLADRRNRCSADYMELCGRLALRHAAFAAWTRLALQSLKYDFSGRRLARLLLQAARGFHTDG